MNCEFGGTKNNEDMAISDDKFNFRLTITKFYWRENESESESELEKEKEFCEINCCLAIWRQFVLIQELATQPKHFSGHPQKVDTNNTVRERQN